MRCQRSWDHPGHPDREAVRVSLRPEAFDELGKFEFIGYRKKGAEPSEIPEDVTNKIVDWVLTRSEEELLSIERLPDFAFPELGRRTFGKVKCAKCGEYVFELYIRLVNGEQYCIPCSGYKV